MRAALARVSAVPVTPFFGDGAIDEASLVSVVRRMQAQGVAVIVPCGGTGEFSQLTADERDRVARLTIDAAGDAAVLVGVGGDLDTATRATRTARAAGAAGVMVHALTDPYLTDDGFVRYIERIASASDGAVVAYLRGRLPALEVLERVARLEQVVAVKWAVADLQAFAEFAARCGGDVVPVCGLAESWAPYFALAGGRGFTSGLVNVDAHLPLRLADALAGRDYATAMKHWRRILPFEQLRARHNAGNNVPAVKEAMAIIGIIPSATVRPPLAPLCDADRVELERIVADIMAPL